MSWIGNAFRAWAWNVNDRIEWLDDPQPYYEREKTVDRYDPEALRQHRVQSLSTMKSPVSGATVALMQERRLTRVIDIGCGAGAFYALASRHIPGLEYYGLDASRAQVARARRNFPGVAFEVADAGALTREAIGQYEAAHLYSVLPFMAVTAQLRLLDEVLASGAAAVLQVEATCRGVYWVPRSTFRNLGKVVVDGRKLLSTVSLPYQREVDRIVSRHTAFEIDWSERSAAITQLINASGRAGGGFLVGSVKDIPKRRFARWWLRSDRRGRMLTGIIRPRGWCVPDSVVGPESLKDDCSSC